LDDFDIESVPVEARQYVEPMLALVQEAKEQAQNEMELYQDLNTEITTLIKSIEEAGKGDLEPIMSEYNNVSEAFNLVSSENIQLAQRMFKIKYPDFDAQPENVRTAFVKALRSERFHDRYEGDTIYDKMSDAYELIMYRSGRSISVSQQSSEPVSPKPPSKKAAKQSLIAGGSKASNLPKINLDNMSFEDILSRGEHLLDM